MTRKNKHAFCLEYKSDTKYQKNAYQFVRSIITCLSLQSLNERFLIIFLLTKYLKTICQLWRYYLLTTLTANSRKLSMPVLRQNQYPFILFLAEKNYIYMTWTFKIMFMWHGKKFFIKPPTAVSPRTLCLFFSKQFDTLQAIVRPYVTFVEEIDKICLKGFHIRSKIKQQ